MVSLLTRLLMFQVAMEGAVPSSGGTACPMADRGDSPQRLTHVAPALTTVP